MIYIATRPTLFQAARELFLAMAPRTGNPDAGVEGLRYFHYRHLWETKQYGKLTADQVEFLNQATKRFQSPQTDARYQQWLSGQITAGEVTEEFRKLAPKQEVSFRTELVDGQVALFETDRRRRNRQSKDSAVTDGSESTFGPVFKPVFGAGAKQVKEN